MSLPTSSPSNRSGVVPARPDRAGESSWAPNCRPVKRRQFLQGSLAASALLGLSGCQGCSAPSLDSGAEPGPYSVWRELQSALRKSPDHPIGRAQALVEKKDLASLHAFVRDEIRLIPASSWRLQLGSETPFGSRAALRAGAGTAREKAEVLAHLVRQMGLQAEVLEGASKARASDCFFRETEQPFAPPISSKQARDWRNRLGPSDPKLSQVRTFADRSQAMSESVLGALGSSQERVYTRPWEGRLHGQNPLVRIEQSDGSMVLADIVDPQAQLVAYDPASKLKPAAPVSGCLQLEVALLASRLSDPQEAIELARGSWSAEEVAGRQLRLAFVPTVPTSARWNLRFADLQSFLPVISLQRLDGSQVSENDVVTGKPFTVQGGWLSEESSASAPPLPTQELELDIDPSRFPEVRLRFQALDSSSQPVRGLNPASIVCRDEGQQVGFTLRSNDEPPHIVFLADHSLSMPKEFRGATSEMQTLVERVKKVARELHPQARVELRGTNSNLWEHLYRASARGCDLIVYVTDGDLDGKIADEAMRQALAQGPPALVVDVRGPSRREISGQMAQATGGELFEASPQHLDQLEEAIVRFLRGRLALDRYQLTYLAPGPQPLRRTLELTVGECRKSQQYDVPANPAAAERLIRLQLEIKVGKRKQLRHLAGYPGVGEPLPQHWGEVQGALFGTHLLAVEGPSPSASVLLDELLQAKLSLESLDKALGAGADRETLESHLEQGIWQLPGQLCSLLAPTTPHSGQDYCFAERDFRMALYSEFPIFETDRLLRRVDLLPGSATYVLAEQPARRRQLAVQASLRRAQIEGEIFPISTFSLLQGRPLTRLDRRPYGKLNLEREQLAQWHHLMERLRAEYPHPGAYYLGPEQGNPLALWAFDAETGEVLGILPDGSGGGSAALQLERQLGQLDQVISGLNLLAAAAGGGGAISGLGAFSLGLVAAYGQRLARLYAAAAVAVAVTDASALDAAVRTMLAGMACELARSIAMGGFASAGSVAGRAVDSFGTVENVYGLAGGSSPFSCPV